jgi:hypothetical protein
MLTTPSHVVGRIQTEDASHPIVEESPLSITLILTVVHRSRVDTIPVIVTHRRASSTAILALSFFHPATKRQFRDGILMFAEGPCNTSMEAEKPEKDRHE